MSQIHNSSYFDKAILLPLPPEASFTECEDMELYGRFMRHVRCVPNNRMEIKILSSIQFTADMLGYSDARVAKALIDFGLRAPRLAFPADFLKFADRSLMRSPNDIGGPNKALQELKRHWDFNGEDKFAAFKGEYDLVDAGAYI